MKSTSKRDYPAAAWWPATLLPLLLLSGCGTAPHTIDPLGREAVTTLEDINIQDWQSMADRLVASLTASGKLATLPQPVVIAFDRIKNNTQQHTDTALLEKKLRVALSAKGVQFTNAEGLGEKSPYSNQARRDAENARAFEKGSSQIETQQKRAAYTIGGAMIERRARLDNDKQTTFVFQLSLNEIATGVTIWEDEQMVAKKATRPMISP